MPKYRKKPVVIEAIQFTRETMNQVYNFVRCNTSADFEDGEPILKVQTIHGDTAIVRLGDWVVKEPISGMFYPVKSDVFEQTYEPVE